MVWTGAVDVFGTFKTTSTSGTATLTVTNACVADGGSWDPSLSNSDGITLTPNGSASSKSSFSKTGLTISGCAAGSELMWQGKITANTLNSGDAKLVEITFVYRVSILTGS
jgi:hypothetical protein